jgi:F-type H+-transporting ATPase subunit delta
MEELTAAGHYARALFDICAPRRLVDRAYAELELVAKLTRDAADLHRFLDHPEIPPAEKRRVLKRLLPAELLPEVVAFLNLLVEHRQMGILEPITQAFLARRHERFGILRAKVETAHALSAESRNRLKEALVAATGRDVFITEVPCPELIGGVRVQVGDRIIDGSIAGRLEQIREQMLSTA